MSTPDPGTEVVSAEFVLKVNDVIESANRIERRYDTHHAELVLLHAFARYSAHHYRTTIKVDGEREREAFIDYIAGVTRGLIARHISDLVGPVQVAGAANETEPSAE